MTSAYYVRDKNKTIYQHFIRSIHKISIIFAIVYLPFRDITKLIELTEMTVPLHLQRLNRNRFNTLNAKTEWIFFSEIKCNKNDQIDATERDVFDSPRDVIYTSSMHFFFQKNAQANFILLLCSQSIVILFSVRSTVKLNMPVDHR